MACIDLRLFGGFEARRDTGEKISLPTRKAEALLAYLALAPTRSRSRDHLAGMLWSDRAEAQAKASLRQGLTALRRGLEGNGATVLRTDGESVSLAPEAISVDALTFEGLAANGSKGDLVRADKLYQGPLLDGVGVRDRAFHEWLTQERRRLHELAINAVDRWLAGLLRDGDHAQAISVAERLLTLDPLRESTYRTLMRLYSAQQQRGLAARQFERCRKVLVGELGIEPAPATQRLYEEIVGAGDDSEASEPVAPRLPAPLPLPSKPSVVVLPFANQSGDADQSYLSDGLTDDVITDLSRFRSLFVIGAESSLALKNRPSDLSRIARDLGVEYAVEGSVRRAGDTLRVTVQLVDPLTGHRLWAERYDRPFAEVFDIQDEIVANIAGALVVNIEHARAERTRHLPSETLDAYDCCLRARQSIMAYTPEGFAKAKVLFLKATKLDPDYAPAWAGLSKVYNLEPSFSPGLAPDRSVAEARACAEKALSLDRTSGAACAALAWVHLNLREHDLAREFLDQATALAPNDMEVLGKHAFVRAYLGEFDAAIEAADYALRVNPFNADYYLDAKAMSYFLTGRHREAARLWGQIAIVTPDCTAWYAANYAYLGDEKKARRKAEDFLRDFGALWQGDPGAGLEDYVRWVVEVSNPLARDEDRRRLIDGLRLAGLPA